MNDEDELDQLPEYMPCPMGCGRTTDDPYGGPCTDCWDNVPKEATL
jgi:hypothetical protein